MIAAGPTRLEPMPNLDGEHCLLCHRRRDVTSQIFRTADESPVGDLTCYPCADLEHDLLLQLSLWLCPECRMSIEIRQQKKETAGVLIHGYSV